MRIDGATLNGLRPEQGGDEARLSPPAEPHADFTAMLTLVSANPGDGRAAPTAVPRDIAGEKLTELLMAQALRSMFPKSAAQGDSELARDAWRGMLADQVAAAVSPRMGPLLALVPASSAVSDPEAR